MSKNTESLQKASPEKEGNGETLKWCQCDAPDFNGDYMDAKCSICKKQME